MTYLSRQDTFAKRADPALILVGCQRVISLAMPYPAPQAPLNATPPGQGRISAYARTRDYHETLWEKLGQLEAFIIDRTRGAAQGYILCLIRARSSSAGMLPWLASAFLGKTPA
jgi:epoxyqueuosine reductase QueG